MFKYLWLDQISLIVRNFISGYKGWEIDELCSLTTTVRVAGRVCDDGLGSVLRMDASLTKCGKINMSN